MPKDTVQPRSVFLRILPLICIAIAAAFVWYFDLHTLLTFENLKAERLQLQEFVTANFVLASLTFMGIYIAVVALSLPGATLLSLTSGFLFGYTTGTLYIIFSATVGACIIFLVARFIVGESFAQKGGDWIAKLQNGFNENAFNYLLTLRLIPLFPFFVLNFVPALLGMRFTSFALATAIGIIPGSFVYALSGAGLDSVFASGGDFSVGSVLTPEILFAFTGLGIMSVLPVLYKRMKKTR